MSRQGLSEDRPSHVFSVIRIMDSLFSKPSVMDGSLTNVSRTFLPECVSFVISLVLRTASIIILFAMCCGVPIIS